VNKKTLSAVIILAIIGVGVLNWKSALIKPLPLSNAKNGLSDKNALRAASNPLELSKIKVAILYEPITRYKPFNRTVEDIMKVLNETGADFVFRCFWRWNPCPETPEQLPPGKLRERCKYVGYYYQHLEQVISAIKASMPDIILCGAIPAQILHSRLVWNPVTGEVISYPETWEMALDPGKWGIPVEKEEFQCWFAKTHLWVPKDLDWRDYDPAEVLAYFPDITNPKFQELLLSWAYKQIDCGVDAIWIDMLFAQARFLAKMTGDMHHEAVRESFEAACWIVDSIHEYGLSKGRYIYVGSWPGAIYFPYTPPKLDFVTISPSSREVFYMEFNETRYEEMLTSIRNVWGDIPVFAFIDWAATTKTPLGVFSQNLTKDEQRAFLRIADEFFQARGINFVYPVHGGWLGANATVKAFGKFNVYDSQAPEFDTYETIVELAQKKASLKSGVEVDVVDLRGEDLKTRLFVLSLQGIVNRKEPRLYVLWESKRVEPTASERWLEYYREKGWIKGYRIISIEEALEKYKRYLKGVVIYDSELPATINLAVSLAGVYDLVVAHPDFTPMLAKHGLEVKYDLRGKFRDRIEVHEWQLENVFPYCNKSLINLFPTVEGVMIYRVSIIDYVIANRACSIGLNVKRDEALIGEYYEKMDKFAIALGYPEDAVLERPWVELTSKYGLLNVLATTFSPNFSFHSKISAKRKYEQDHKFEITLDSDKIYVAFAVSDLGLNSMQDFYYEMWLSEARGDVPIGWWLDPIVVEFCPGIVQYYYETKTPNDYFYSAHVGGRIRASDFPYLNDYLRRGQKYLDRCSLKIVAFSNHHRKDDRVFKLYSETLDVEGFIFGFGPEFKDEYWLVGDKVWIVPRYMGSPEAAFKAVKKYIDSRRERPLFIVVGVGLWYYPKVEDVIEIRDMLKEEYSDQILFCRLDELIAAAKQYSLAYEPVESKLRLLVIILALVIAVLASSLILLRLKYRKPALDSRTRAIPDSDIFLAIFDSVTRVLKPGGLYFLDWCVNFQSNSEEFGEP